MEQERTHQQRSADTDGTHDLGCLAHRRDLFLRYPTLQVRTGDDTQRPVLLTTVVEVEPHGNHVLQNLGRRLNVEHIRLDRPRSEPLSLDALMHGNGHVLMLGNLPVRIGNLVEQNAPDREEPGSENRLDQRPDRL